MRLLLFMAAMLASFTVVARVVNPVGIMNEAEDYLTVNPAHSIVLLEQIEAPDELPDNLFLRWHLIMMRASVPTNQLTRLMDSLEKAFTKQSTPYFKNNITSITSALGIWLRRERYYQDAQTSLDCSFKYAQNDRQRLTLTNSMALVAREQGAYKKARNLYARSKLLAEQMQQTPVLAMIENNLGIIALDQGNINEAEQLFRKALSDYQEIDKRSGKISAGINLLFVFVIKEQVVNYQRLIESTSKLTAIFPNQSKQALLLWLNARFEQLQGNEPDDKLKLALKVAYEELQSDKVKAQVHKYLAPKLNVDVSLPLQSAKQNFAASWFSAVEACNWD
ncbi:tetratricopeptide repeat protein [Pseudoalteromonas sp. S16_S37]|uniref:tetratricopeptide repeat protein n=1 Tax=Pseudoalteromonas sp. S16_S37 TaxID=2720228 RepID=UPI001EEEC807|nr:tetratricopeptide repeat protein [Pseudoalteromonas sp. S16_S37]